MFKSDFDYEDFSDESIAENLIYVNVSAFDKDGKYAVSLTGIPAGKYTYSLNDVKGEFTSSDKETIENIFNEVCENPEKIEEYGDIFGIEKEVFEQINAAGIEPGAVLEDILKRESYDITELQTFVQDLLDELYEYGNNRLCKRSS